MNSQGHSQTYVRHTVLESKVLFVWLVDFFQIDAETQQEAKPGLHCRLYPTSVNIHFTSETLAMLDLKVPHQTPLRSQKS